MIRRPAAVLAVLLASAAVSLSDVPAKGEGLLARLTNLYEGGRYFELRDALAAIKDDSSIEAEFYRGAVEAAKAEERPPLEFRPLTSPKSEAGG